MAAVMKTFHVITYQPGTVHAHNLKAFMDEKILAMEVGEREYLSVFALKMPHEDKLRFVDERGGCYDLGSMMEHFRGVGPLYDVDRDVVEVDRALMKAFAEALGGDAGALYDEAAFRKRM
ncbi:hypothetical protein AC578_924 [Pseudocercospora eumusae]|uniref:Uncharacterized protein n=1 Tax=Pseudocercospora eumusae TaxID=321146 RepID=A0A139HBW1_9PEZI|nr:hypothetical protein AC578_924 [Pseudocercospora eumusae]